MPNVVVEWFAGRSNETKRELGKEIIALVSEHGKVPPESIQVRFVDIDPADFVVPENK